MEDQVEVEGEEGGPGPRVNVLFHLSLPWCALLLFPSFFSGERGEYIGCRVGVFAHHDVGCVGAGRVPPEDRGEDESGEEGGPGPP